MSHLAAGKMRERGLVAGCQFAQLNACAVLVLRAEGRAGVGRRVPVSCLGLGRGGRGQTGEKPEAGREPLGRDMGQAGEDSGGSDSGTCKRRQGEVDRLKQTSEKRQQDA